jgi:hypothetical protein
MTMRARRADRIELREGVRFLLGPNESAARADVLRRIGVELRGRANCRRALHIVNICCPPLPAIVCPKSPRSFFPPRCADLGIHRDVTRFYLALRFRRDVGIGSRRAFIGNPSLARSDLVVAALSFRPAIVRPASG